MITEKNTLYSFSIDIEKEIEENVEKKSKRKNKDTGKMETITSTEKVKVKKLVHKNHKTAIKTYNLLNIYQHNSYFANDILVHNKRDVNDGITEKHK